MTLEDLVRLITEKLAHKAITHINIVATVRLAEALLAFAEENVSYMNPILDRLLAVRGIENLDENQIREKAEGIYRDILESLSTFKCEFRKALPPTEALYIIGFDEIFTEIEDINEQKKILSNLERKIGFAILAQQPIFINYNQNANFKELLQYTELHAYITEILVIQKKVGLQLSKEKFFVECQDRDVSSMCIGGVFGDACVWGFTTELAKEIFTKLTPSDPITHPNIRFSCLRSGYQCDYAVIDEDITEGHTDPSKLFPQYLTFSQTVLLKTAAETFENEIEYDPKDPQALRKDFKDLLEQYLERHGKATKRNPPAAADSPIHADAKKARTVLTPDSSAWTPATANLPDSPSSLTVGPG